MKEISERSVIALVSAIQFINILDFMMVMPLGPNFAEALGIAPSEVGIVGGSYTAAAAVSGFIGSFFLDRFDRKWALVFALSGLVLGTIAAAFAVDLKTLILARVVAGIFGGPASSLSLAVVADVIPEARRGRAMGIVMGSFSIASVLGVPAGLWLAELGNWQTPFFALGCVGTITVYLMFKLLPNLRVHLDANGKSIKRIPLIKLLSRRPVILTYLMAVTIMTAAFLIIPNIATYVQINLGYPRSQMGTLYMAGGIVSFFLMRLAGILTDKKGAIFTSSIGTVIIIAVFYFGFYNFLPALTVTGIFILFMAGMSIRNVAYQTFASKVPRPEERAGFLSIQSTVQHLACAVGAFLSSHFLYELPDKTIGGMQGLALTSIILSLFLPYLMYLAKPTNSIQNAGQKL